MPKITFSKTILITLLCASLTSFSGVNTADAGSKKLKRILGGAAATIVIGTIAKKVIDKRKRKKKVAKSNNTKRRSLAKINQSSKKHKAPSKKKVVVSKPKIVNKNGSALAQAQYGLSVLGLYNIDIDGKDGPSTRKAVKKYQASKNYSVTGLLLPQQQKELANIGLAEKKRLAASTQLAYSRPEKAEALDTEQNDPFASFVAPKSTITKQENDNPINQPSETKNTNIASISKSNNLQADKNISPFTLFDKEKNVKEPVSPTTIKPSTNTTLSTPSDEVAISTYSTDKNIEPQKLPEFVLPN